MFLEGFKIVFTLLLITHYSCKIGLYSLRNTAYILGICTDGDCKYICKSARQKTVISFTYYEQNISISLEMIH